MRFESKMGWFEIVRTGSFQFFVRECKYFKIPIFIATRPIVERDVQIISPSCFRKTIFILGAYNISIHV